MLGAFPALSRVVTWAALLLLPWSGLQASALTSGFREAPDIIPMPLTLSETHNHKSTSGVSPPEQIPEQNRMSLQQEREREREQDPEPDTLDNPEHKQVFTVRPHKKRKKPSQLERLRQLYFLPLLHQLGRRG